MFRKSRRKIVAAIMSVLVLLWVGTLGVIYASSYYEMKHQNEQMLQAHTQMYTLAQSFEQLDPHSRPKPDGDHGSPPEFDPESPKFRLSTFYSVAISYDGEILETSNASATVYTNDSLEKLARDIVEDNKTTGTEDNLTFLAVDKGGYHLVAFVDNTVVNDGAITLLRYTLIFGGVALVLFFFLACFLAKRIVAPLEESYRRQKQFISDAGHELKTPVSVVSANAELLSRQLGDNQWLRNIHYENERMGLLVGQLLDLARTENVTSQTEHIDLSHLVAGEVLPFESVAFENGLTLRSDIANDLFVEGNSAQLKQLTAILLDNAIRHSKTTGEVILRLTKKHGVGELSVTNPGDEIPAEHRARIFERFYRMDTARSGEDGHYGLGLAIAKSITQSHQGQIQVLCDNGLIEFRASIPLKKDK